MSQLHRAMRLICLMWTKTASLEIVVENMRVEVSEGDVDGIQRRDNTDKHKVDRIIQEIVTNVLE